MQVFKNVEHLLCYDGQCLFCDRIIRFLLKKDKSKKFFFCSLQSELTQNYLASIGCEDAKTLKTVVYVKSGKPFIKSNAAIHVLNDLGGGWKWVGFLLKILPLFIRDFMYQLISKHRYKVFGQLASCNVPDETEKKRFLAL